MEETMSDRLSRYKILIVEVGSFLIFTATYGRYVCLEVWHVIQPLFMRKPPMP